MFRIFDQSSSKNKMTEAMKITDAVQNLADKYLSILRSDVARVYLEENRLKFLSPANKVHIYAFVIDILRLVREKILTDAYFEEYERSCLFLPLKKFKDGIYLDDPVEYEKILQIISALFGILNEEEKNEVLTCLLSDLGVENAQVRQFAFHFLFLLNWGYEQKNRIKSTLQKRASQDPQSYFFLRIMFGIDLNAANLITYFKREKLDPNSLEVNFIWQKKDIVVLLLYLENYIEECNLTGKNITIERFFNFNYGDVIDLTYLLHLSDEELNLVLPKFFNILIAGVEADKKAQYSNFHPKLCTNAEDIRRVYARLSAENKKIIEESLQKLCNLCEENSADINARGREYVKMLGMLAYIKLSNREVLPEKLRFSRFGESNFLRLVCEVSPYFIDKLPDDIRPGYIKLFVKSLYDPFVEGCHDLSISYSHELISLVSQVRRNLSFADSDFLLNEIVEQKSKLSAPQFFISTTYQSIVVFVCVTLFKSYTFSTEQQKQSLFKELQGIIEKLARQTADTHFPLHDFRVLAGLVIEFPEEQQRMLSEWLLNEKLTEGIDAKIQWAWHTRTHIRECEILFYYYLLAHLPIADNQLEKLMRALENVVSCHFETIEYLDGRFDIDDMTPRQTFVLLEQLLDHLQLINDRAPQIFTGKNAKDKKAFAKTYGTLMNKMFSGLDAEHEYIFPKLVAVYDMLGEQQALAILDRASFYRDWYLEKKGRVLSHLQDLLPGGEQYSIVSKKFVLMEKLVTAVLKACEDLEDIKDNLFKLTTFFSDNEMAKECLRARAPVCVASYARRQL